MIQFKNLEGLEYSEIGGITLISVGVLAVISLIVVAFYWIKYSWVRKTNSQNLDGMMVTRKVLENSALANVEIKKSMMYAKYWNHNKKKGTYRLRPWTHDRQSLWTIMEATSQAYASSVRENKSKEFWLLFRLPSIIRTVAILIALLAGYLLLNSGASIGIFVTAIIGIVTIPFLIANCGAFYMLMENAMPLVRTLGLTDEEVKIIKKIYVIRFVFAVVATVLDLMRLAIQLSESRTRK